MATTYTPRLGLPKQAGGDLVDVSLIRAAMDKIDSDSDANVVTSGTRPGSPYIGQIIFETDTSRLLFWNGTTWWPVGTQTMAKATTGVTTGNVFAASMSDMFSVAATLFAGPAVLRFSGTIQNGGSGAVRTGGIQVMQNTVAVPGTFAIVGQGVPWIVSNTPVNQSLGLAMDFDLGALAAGATTFKVQGIASLAGAVVLINARLWVEQGGV